MRPITLEQRLQEWVSKVLAIYNDDTCMDEMGVNNYCMLTEVDAIIAEEFDIDPVFMEEYCRNKG